MCCTELLYRDILMLFFDRSFTLQNLNIPRHFIETVRFVRTNCSDLALFHLKKSVEFVPETDSKQIAVSQMYRISSIRFNFNGLFLRRSLKFYVVGPHQKSL